MELKLVLMTVVATCAGAAALAAAPGGAEPQHEPERPAEQASTSDAVLAAQVKADLARDETTNARRINVEVNRGQVQLSGYVESPEHKAAATRVASNVAGVTRVQNNLQIESTGRSTETIVDDGLITAKVKAALIADSRTKAHQIDVNTREGAVQLGGFVDSPDAKIAASEVARSVSGVTTLHNNLEVKQ